MDEWFSVPIWKSSLLPARPARNSAAGRACLLFTRGTRLEETIASRLGREGYEIIRIRPGDRFAPDGSSGYFVNPKDPAAYDSLLEALTNSGRAPALIIHCWALGTPAQIGAGESELTGALDLGFYSLLFLSQSLERQVFDQPIQFKAVVNGIADISQEEASRPENGLMLGASLVMSQTLGTMRCSCIDIPLEVEEPKGSNDLTDGLLAELLAADSQSLVVLRGGVFI
jgi:hypothetical protein